MAHKRRIKLDPNAMTLLSGIATYAYRRPNAGEAQRYLDEFRRENVISKDVYEVGTIILQGEVPLDASPDVKETAEYYLDVAKSYFPTQEELRKLGINQEPEPALQP